MDRHYTRSLAFLLRPTDEEFHAMLAELGETVGKRRLSSVLGISILTLDGWRKGKNGPSAGARKLVWLIWALIFHPEKLRSVFHVMTWGRFTRPENAPRACAANEDWSI